ncbi:uncharacterized protein G2W53_033402 [Senna tora]|uniref:Uncharacterized protein n=1 Tax=Senna tora TaxID=362788 RepID=A0A834SZ66_9FABA|nr:uncharacterized protein G2W53_033402 [Senna tora]
MELVNALKELEVMSKHILNQKSQLNLKRTQEAQVKHVPQVSQTDRYELYLGI